MTREQAIKIIKEFINGTCLHLVDQEALETLIPELCDSEDERIRKNLIGLVNLTLDKSTSSAEDHACREMFAYLEKQKEQDGEDKESTDFTIYHPLKNGKGEYECIPYSFYGSLTSFSEDKDLIDFLRTCFYTEEECNEWIEQQKEQKPILKFKVGDKIHLIDGTSPNYEDDCITIRAIGTLYYIGEFKEGYVPIEQQDRWELVKEQKPVGYLDRDKVYAIMTKLTNLSYSQLIPINSDEFKKLHEITSDVRDLLDYPIEQKQEWGEEDEAKKERLISIVKRALYGNEYPLLNDNGATELITWLKSLRPQPHWKPSEEQMEAFKNSVEHIPNAYYDDMWELYEQLKKQM